MVEGPAGVGKTALLDAARDAAGERGLLRPARPRRRARARVRVRRRAPAVRRRRARRRTTREPVRGRRAPRRAAARRARGDAARGPSDDPFAARHALYWLTANLAAERPLALLVDDAHWADAASLAALAHIANRLEGMPVALVVASRAEESSPALDALRRAGRRARDAAAVAPLGEEAAARGRPLVRAGRRRRALPRLPRRDRRQPVPAPRAGALAAPSGDGAAAAARGGAEPRARHARGRRAPGAAARAAGAARARPRRCSARTSRCAGRPRSPASTGRGGRGRRRAGRRRRAAQRAAARVPASAGRRGRVRRARPGGAVADHGRAARLLAGEGASPERVAAQLLRCQPAGDPWACEQLSPRPGWRAARGAAEAAARYLRRALDEPRAAASRAQILLELGARGVDGSDPRRGGRAPARGAGRRPRAEQRFAATMLLAGLLGHTYRVGRGGRRARGADRRARRAPDLRGAGRGRADQHRADRPATRPRAAPVDRAAARAGRLRRRARPGRARRGRDRDGDGRRAAADRRRRVAERALAGFDAAPDRRRLVLLQRRRARWSSPSATTSRCARSTARSSGRASAAR